MIWSALEGGEIILVKDDVVCKNYDMVRVKGGEIIFVKNDIIYAEGRVI